MTYEFFGKLFTDLLGVKRGEVSEKLNRYKVGVTKLNETKVIVDKLKKQLIKLKPEIEQSQKDT